MTHCSSASLVVAAVTSGVKHIARVPLTPAVTAHSWLADVKRDDRSSARGAGDRRQQRVMTHSRGTSRYRPATQPVRRFFVQLLSPYDGPPAQSTLMTAALSAGESRLPCETSASHSDSRGLQQYVISRKSKPRLEKIGFPLTVNL